MALPSRTLMNMRVYLIRHAESTFNVWKATLPDDEKTKHPLRGHRNCGITDLGKAQCERLRNHLKSEGLSTFDSVVVSALRRTRETLDGLKLESTSGGVLVTPLCREYAIDECDFLEEEEIVLENEEQLKERVENFKQWLLRECAGSERVAVVTHSDFIHALRGDSDALKINNCEYIVMNL